LVSLPYGDYGGFLFSNLKVDWILKKLDGIAKENDVDYVEIREPNVKFGKHLKSFETKFQYYNFVLNLNQPLEDIWKSFDKKVRNSIRKAEKNHVKVVEGNRKDLEEFYKLYLNTMKKLGSPPHSFDYFDNIFKFCSKNVKLLFAEYDDKKIAASIFFFRIWNLTIFVESVIILQLFHLPAPSFFEQEPTSIHPCSTKIQRFKILFLTPLNHFVKD